MLQPDIILNCDITETIFYLKISREAHFELAPIRDIQIHWMARHSISAQHITPHLRVRSLHLSTAFSYNYNTITLLPTNKIFPRGKDLT